MVTKTTPASRKAPRERLAASLDAIFAESLSPDHTLDAVECKLFGIGSESYVVGSHEFYLGYAISRNKVLCLDAGHFHPTEVISDKISSVLMYVPELLLHVSRGVRWDSDHVVTYTDELQAIMQEIVRGDYLDRVHIGLDFFDASINRVAAWAIGTRNASEGRLGGIAGTDRTAAATRTRWRLHGSAGTDGRTEDDAVRRRLGLLLSIGWRARRSRVAGEGSRVRSRRRCHNADNESATSRAVGQDCPGNATTDPANPASTGCCARPTTIQSLDAREHMTEETVKFGR